ncbi:MAG: hypothetical protein ACR2LL_08190 [Nitrosopumilus sp.]|uniref:hypothetical protein n=1 Tax=Nitrosopumilus sp. TaxID=2024843 RepID=UPI00292FC6D6|nr:hypothetical protein [Nitrosopumilus sp.]
MSESTDSSLDFFAECKKNTEKFFNEIDKSTPVYHQIATDIQKNYLDAWKKVMDSSISLQQEFAAKTGQNISMSEDMKNTIQNMIENSITAYQNQNKIAIDSAEASKKVFDVIGENTKIFGSLNKNIMEFMESTMKKYSRN